MPSFTTTVLVDTGFWYALYDPIDQYHRQALDKADILETANVLIPWPSLYETFNSRFAKNRVTITRFKALLQQAHVERIPDEPYREEALREAFNSSLTSFRNLSLVDTVIRQILGDPTVVKHALLTFNPRDFHDVCHKYQIEMW